MIIWRGWGFLAFLYAFAAFAMVMMVTDALVPGGNLPFLFGSGLLLAAVATWFTGLLLNQSGPRRKLAAVNELTNRHTFFFIPLQYWGFVLGALAMVSLISDAVR